LFGYKEGIKATNLRKNYFGVEEEGGTVHPKQWGKFSRSYAERKMKEGRLLPVNMGGTGIEHVHVGSEGRKARNNKPLMSKPLSLPDFWTSTALGQRPGKVLEK